MVKKLSELAALLEGATVRGNQDIEITDIVQDSRQASPGAMFVALAGAHVDGHRFIPQVVEKGAVAVITERDIELPQGIEAVLIVKDIDAALKKIVPFFYDYPGQTMRLIGITGTNGKTTSSYLIRAMLRAAGHKVGVIGTIQIMIEEQILPIHNTTPNVVDLQRTLHMMREQGVTHVVMEVSSHALDQNRVAGCEFDTAVFTNLTQDHLDYHKTMENYLAAKTRLFTLLDEAEKKPGKTAVVNIDDAAAEKLLSAVEKAAKVTCSTKGEAGLKAEQIHVHAGGASFVVKGAFGEMPLNLKITGMFNVYNVLGAIGAGLAEGVAPETVQAALNSFTGVPGRFELVDEGQDFAVIVDYAHTPDGLENILHTAREITEKRIITVFGCGGDRDRTKRPIMGRLAAELSDVVIATSDNPRTEDPAFILEEVEAGVLEKIGTKQHEKEIDRRKAIFRAIEIAEAGDIVVIAGKGHEDYQILKDKTIHFDDREVAREALGGRR